MRGDGLDHRRAGAGGALRGESVPGRSTQITDPAPSVPGKRTLTEGIQRKAERGGASDPLERQADEAADAVVAGRSPAPILGGGELGVRRKELVSAAVATSVAGHSVLVDDSATAAPGQLPRLVFFARLEPQLRAAAARELGSGFAVARCPYITRYLALYRARPVKDTEAFIRRYTGSQATTADQLIADLLARAAEGVRYWMQTHQAPPALVSADPEAAAAADTAAPSESQANALAGPQRKAASGAPAAASGPSGILARLGDGAPLDQATASRMGSAFGTSFSDVRIHADDQGGALAREQSAHAFTLGSHVAFAPGRYQPGTVEGDALLAHELTHVLQQRGAAAPGPQHKAAQPRHGIDAAEHDADRAAIAAVQHLHGGPGVAPVERAAPTRSADFQLQRCEGTLNEGEQEMLGFYRQGFTAHGDPFELQLGHHVPKGPMDQPLLNIAIHYAGRDDADNPMLRGVLLLPPGKSTRTPKITTDKPADWTDMKLDVFGDASWIGGIHHTVVELPGWSPKSRQHTFSFTGPRDQSPLQTVIVKSAGALSIDAAQAHADPKHETGPLLRSDVAVAAAKLTLDEMLSSKAFALDAGKPPWAALRAKVDAAVGKPAGDSDDARRLTRLQETLSHVRPIFLALGAASNPDAYLPDISATALQFVAEVRHLYEAALAGAWQAPVDLGAADAAFNALWHRLTALYLQKGKGVDAMVQSGQNLAQDIVNMTGSGEKPFDRIRNQLGVGKGGTNVLRTAEQVEIVRREFTAGAKGSLAKVSAVVEDAQVITGLGTLIVTDQLFHKFKAELAGIVGKVADKTPGTRNLTRVCDERIATIEALAQTVEDALAGARTQDELAAALRTTGRAAVSKFQALANTREYKQDLKDIQSRIKTVKVLETLAKVLAIMAVAALTGGAAGAAVGTALEGMGASAGVVATGEFAAEVAAFTLTSRLGNDLAFGKNETSLGEDLLTNALMMGTMKAAAQVYGKVFKLIADPRKYKTAYAVGGAMTGFVALQMFAEVHTLVKTGKVMDWDDRMRGLLSNALLMSAMALGGYLVKVARTNPAMHDLAARNAGPALAALDAQIAQLAPQIEQIRAGGPRAADLAADLVPRLQELWQKQLEVFAEAVKAEKDPAAQARARETFKATTEAFNRELARLDLQLASAGIDVQMAPGAGAGSHLFEPIKPGFVKFKPGGKQVIEDFYKQTGGKLEPVPGKDGLYRGTDASGETFFAEEARADKLLDDGKHTGALKGKDVYPENTYIDGEGKEQPAKLNEKKIKDAVTGSKKAPPRGTKLDVVSVSGKTAQLKMEVATAGATAEVTVNLTVKPRDSLSASSSHGADAGPARLDLTRGADGKWTAIVEVSETMRPEDVQFAIDHELVEAAELIRRYPGGEPKGGFGKEMESGVMKPGATTDKATAHDVAAAQEVVDLWNDHKNLVKNKSPKAAARKQILDKAMEAQGLNDTTQVPAKIDLLRKAGAPEDMLIAIKQREAKRVFDEHVANDLGGKRASSFTPALVAHLLFPEPRGLAGEAGVTGGHHTIELTNLANAPNRFSVGETGLPKVHGGTTYRHFEQFSWNGDIAQKPHFGTPEAPGGAKFDASKWTPLSDPKTTFDDPAAFIADAEQGFEAWRATAGSSVSDPKIKFTTPGGVDVIGYLKSKTAPYELLSIFPDSAWIP